MFISLSTPIYRVTQ